MAIAPIFYFINKIDQNALSLHGFLQNYGINNTGSTGPPNTQTMVAPPPSTNIPAQWKLGSQVFGANNYSDLAFNSAQPSGSFSTTPGPSNGTGTSKCFALGTPLYGSFANTTWSLAFAVVPSTPATSGTGNLRARIYRSIDPTGQTNVTELTSSTIVFSNFNLGSGSSQNTTATWSPGTFSLNGEYLFVAISLEVQSGAVSVTGTTISLIQDGTNSKITAPVFTPTVATTLYLIGTGGGYATYPGAAASPDQGIEQILVNGNWYQNTPIATFMTYGASWAFDPNSLGPSDAQGGPGGTAFSMGSQDDIIGTVGNSTFGAQRCYTYNPATSNFVLINVAGPTTDTGPVGYAGFGACTQMNGITYCIGGGCQDTATAVSGVFSWNNSNNSTTGTFVKYGALPSVAAAGMATNFNGLIYHGGGDNYTTVCLNTWYSWNPLTDTRTSLTNIPGVLAGAAIVQLNGYIYLIGGYNITGLGANPQFAGVNSVYRYTVANNTWKTMNNFPVNSSFGSACIWNGNIFCAAGYSAANPGKFNNNPLPNNTVWQYNVGKDSWILHSTTIPSGNSDGSITNTGGVNGFLFAAAFNTTGMGNINSDACFTGMI